SHQDDLERHHLGPPKAILAGAQIQYRGRRWGLILINLAIVRSAMAQQNFVDTPSVVPFGISPTGDDGKPYLYPFRLIGISPCTESINSRVGDQCPMMSSGSVITA